MALSPLPGASVGEHRDPGRTGTRDSTVALLRGHPLFSSLDAADFEQVLFQTRSLNSGHRALLYRQDCLAQHFYFVASGRVRLYRLDATGVERTLDSLGPGECFAEVMIYADPARYACYAESMTQSLVLAIPVSAYREVIRRQTRYAERALCHYAGRAVSRFHDLEVMTVQSARERLIRYLLDLLPVGVREPQTLELPLPKYLVASRLAMQPETLSRLLNELKRKGLVVVKRSHLLVPDPERLRQHCHSSQDAAEGGF